MTVPHVVSQDADSGQPLDDVDADSCDVFFVLGLGHAVSSNNDGAKTDKLRFCFNFVKCVLQFNFFPLLGNFILTF